MSETIKSRNDLNLSSAIESLSSIENKIKSSPVDPQVKPRKNYTPRRSFDTAYKLRILSAYDACENALARGALLRKEGLYHSRIAAWKEQLKNSNLGCRKKEATIRTDNLSKEIDQLKKKLAQAEAIIELQKKVSDLFTTHIL